MRYLDTAFAHLEFALKLMVAAEEGRLDLAQIDQPLTIDEDGIPLVLPDRVLKSEDDLVNALQNYVTITFGAAAITLNRCREEAIGTAPPSPITTETDQWAALVYQIRNAFAHDIAEPRWQYTHRRYAREYRIGHVSVDLRPLNHKRFEYSDIGGAGALFQLKADGEDYAFGRL